MFNDIPFAIWCGLVLAALITIGNILHRILRILTQMNNGEPTFKDMKKIEYGKLHYKE